MFVRQGDVPRMDGSKHNAGMANETRPAASNVGGMIGNLDQVDWNQ